MLRRAAALLLGIALAYGLGAALGYWTGGPGQPVHGSGEARATSVNAGSTPSVSAAGAARVLVSWSPSTMANGAAVDGYLVKRYDAGTDNPQTILASCAGTITATSCTEAGIPVGDWKYTVTPTVGSNWRGTESAKSATISTTTIDFLQPVTSPEQVRSGPAGSDVGDIDNDGDPDIVTSNLYEFFSSVLLNNGVGDFTETLVASNGSSVDVALGKFDNDANLDLVLLYQGTPPGTGLVAIFKGGGNGNFTFAGAANQVINTGVRSTRLAVGNFNGDAIDDVAVLNQQDTPSTTAGTVTTYLGNPAGNNTFSSASPAQTLTAQLGSTDLELADFNGGAADIVVANEASNSVSFFAGNGTGFNAPVHHAAGARVYFLDSANLNNDANRDLVATIRASSPSAIRTLLGDGTGGFPTQTTTAAASANGGDPQGLVADDLDNDGDQDVGVANGNPGSVSVLDNDGTGAFAPVPTSPETGIGAAATYPYELLAADFDGSGYKDLAVSNLFTFPGETRTLLNQSGTKANLSISQSDSPDPVNAGSTLTYTLTVANAGPGTPTVVKASDTLPAGVTFDAGASSPSCSATGTTPVTVTCDYGSVAPGSPEALQVVVTVGWSAPASIANTATVAGNLADPTPADNTSAATTAVANHDTTAPTHALSLDSPVGAFLSGADLYYKGDAAGSFRLVDALSDAQSGPASVTYPAVATTGWTHGAETVTTPAGGPYTSSTFSWTANPSNPTGYTVSGADVAGNNANSALTMISDTTAPATGSVSYTNGMVYTLAVPVTTANGTDAQSGIDASSGLVKRASATLNTATQACGTFGGFTTDVTLVGGADTSVVSGNCYQYRYLVSDRVGNQATYTSASVAKVDTTPYADTVLGTTGLVNYWRLGDSLGSSAFSTDTMSGTAGATLQSRAGETGATWTKHIGVDSVLTDAGRLRKNTASTRSAYYSSGVPPSANYTVEADVHVKSIISGDAIGIVGRQDTSNSLGTFYFASYETSDASWNLGKYVNGTRTYINWVTGQTLTPGQNYRLKLVMNGTSLSVFVNDVLRASGTDASITAAGRAGVRLGQDTGTISTTNTTGMHLDNFTAHTAAPTVAVDSKSANNGTYAGGPTLGSPGALAGDANTAVTFDGIDDQVTAARQIADNFSIEFWFKSTQGLNTNPQWWGNAGLVDAEVGGAANDFGTSLRSDGRVVAGIGTPDVSVVSTNGGYNDGAWHHVVFTRTRATGALALYIDGQPAGTATGASTLSLTSSATVTLGRINGGGTAFAGTLDEVALYNTVLSQATAADHNARGR